MDNTSAQLRLVLPQIPKSWCPSGSNIAEKFQSYQDTYLAQAYLVIPGVTTIQLLDISEIQTQIANLQSQYNALNKAVRYGQTALIPDGEVNLLIVPNMPNNNYFLSLTIVSPEGATASAVHFEVTAVEGSFAVTGCKLLCHNLPSDYVAIWEARQK